MEAPRKPMLFAEYDPNPIARPPGEEIWLRPVEAGDLSSIARLIAERDARPIEEVLQRLRAAEAAPDDRSQVWVAGLGREPGPVLAFARVARFDPPSASPREVAPPGDYLSGVIVDPTARRRGLARALTVARLAWIDQRGGEAHYFCNARNRASIDLHAPFGFVEVTREFWFPGVEFVGGEGMLFRRPKALID